ncbi:MAG: hypothetical protein MUF21_06320 [Gemmatimonadaceae bacterium]|jgi:hypothetical protein|nr:hypothetical protein [Gemmatimonadaceae bacterium]
MTVVRKGLPGATRTCPHCRATILESSARCPQCLKHLRVDPDAASRAASTQVPFKVEGTIKRTAGDDPAEYAIVLVLRDERGQEVSRQVMGVGALLPGTERTFALSVELTSTGRAGAARG